MKKAYLGIVGLSLALSALTVSGSAKAMLMEPDALPDNPYAAMNWYYVSTTYNLIGDFGEPRWDGPHKGIDILVNQTAVYNSQTGKVLDSGTEASMGKYVIVQTNNYAPNTSTKIITRYLHMSEVRVQPGASVSRGQQLGVSGNTGASEGPHLHFDVNEDNQVSGTYMEPEDMVDPKLFWPNAPWSGELYSPTSSFLSSESATVQQDYTDTHWESDQDPEFFFSDVLIDYVGEEKFEAWMLARPVEERKLSLFKNHFSISDALEKQLHDQALAGTDTFASNKKTK